MPVFDASLPHWCARQRGRGVRVRGLYCTKDTFVTAVPYPMRETKQTDDQA